MCACGTAATRASRASAVCEYETPYDWKVLDDWKASLSPSPPHRRPCQIAKNEIQLCNYPSLEYGGIPT